MATTAKGTPYVESSDLVANYPAVSLALAEHIDDFGGKVLQVVRATDVTTRSTTSTSFVDITGLSVTITPQKSTSTILIIGTISGTALFNSGTQCYGFLQITDSANNAQSGAESVEFGLDNMTGGAGNKSFGAYQTLIAQSSPATLSPVSCKLRFRSVAATITMYASNASSTGQIYAIEVSA